MNPWTILQGFNSAHGNCTIYKRLSVQRTGQPFIILVPDMKTGTSILQSDNAE